MSIVGPRPPIPEEVAKYNDHQRRRLGVTQGITCYWQVMGRNELSFDEQVDLDIKYIEEQSLLTDIKILFKTIPAVLSAKGAH
jgi:lipopolysaccharide/colanic/teichoic acid biosynthesis glycosyltransferase